MSAKWKNLVLVASLALNLAFASAFVYKNFLCNRISDGNKDHRVDLNGFEAKLELQVDQERELNVIRKEFNINFLKYKQDILDKRIEIIEELGDPEFSLENLEQKTNELNGLENRLNHAFVQTLIHINSILNSQQRLNFLVKLGRNWFFFKDQSKGEKND